MEYVSVIYPQDYQKRIMTINQVHNSVCTYFWIDDLVRSQKREFVYPAQVFCYICRKKTTSTLRNIADKIGGKHHSTVVHSVQTIQDLIDTDETVREDVERVMDILNRQS